MKLQDICELIVDCPHSTAKDEGAGYPLVRTPNVGKGRLILEGVHRVSESVYCERVERAVPKYGDIILAREAPVGNAAIILQNQTVCLGQRVVLIRVNQTIADPYYLVYYLLSEPVQHRLKNSANGAVVAHLNMNDIRNLEVSLPAISEQKRVANILKSIDDKIDLNNRINHNLEEQAQALYKSWLVDFEPFRDGKFVESELGMIPEGWKVYHMNEMASVTSGYSYKGSELLPSSTAMATIKNFDRNGGFKIDGYKEIIPAKVKPEQHINLFDVIVAHTDLTQAAEIIGNPAVILSKGGYDDIIMSMDLSKVKPQNENISSGLLYCILRDARFKAHALGYVNGTTVLHMSRNAIGEYKIALPTDIQTLKPVSYRIDSLLKMISNNLQEQAILTRHRDTILPKLMSGELNC